jgi:predicted TIM-barrel enzyme
VATFNIGAQNAASIQNVGGDAVIHGGLHASASWETRELRAALSRVEEETAKLPLSATARDSVGRALSEASIEARKATPHKPRIAELLERAARTLKEAGALAGAGGAVVTALRQALVLLGPIGHATLALL